MDNGTEAAAAVLEATEATPAARETRLACPHCGGTNLEAVQRITTHQRATFVREANGELRVDHGDEYRDFPDTLEDTYAAHCCDCILDMSRDELVPVAGGAK